MLLTKIIINLVVIIEISATCLKELQNPSPVVRVCRPKSENTCLGVYIRLHWLIVSSECEHTDKIGSKLLISGLSKECNAGDIVQLNKIHELEQTKDIIFVKVLGHPAYKDVNVASATVRFKVGATSCQGHCLSGQCEPCPFDPIQARLGLCTGYDGDYIDNEICLRTNTNTTSFAGSMIFCKKKLVGYAQLTETDSLKLVKVTTLYDELNEIIHKDKRRISKHIGTSLVKICNNNEEASNICLGVYIKPSWILTSKLCNHVYLDDTIVTMGGIQRDCKGETREVVKIFELQNYEEGALMKLDQRFDSSNNIKPMKVIEKHYGKLSGCTAYCQENQPTEKCRSRIEPRLVSFAACPTLNITEKSLKEKLCVARTNDNRSIPFIMGSPIVCNDQLIGYVVPHDIGLEDPVPILVPLPKFLNEVRKKIIEDKKKLGETKLELPEGKAHISKRQNRVVEWEKDEYDYDYDLDVDKTPKKQETSRAHTHKTKKRSRMSNNSKKNKSRNNKRATKAKCKKSAKRAAMEILKRVAKHMRKLNKTKNRSLPHSGN